MPHVRLVPTRGPERVELPVCNHARVGVLCAVTNVTVYWVDVHPVGH
jgi:hypothetical protein